MPKRVAQSTLNASTVDIINTIRANASYQYQNQVPEIATATDIPVVGQLIMGTPALSNEFLNALINRIALVNVNSAVFNNDFKELKKGMLEYGETVEEIFQEIIKARPYSAEKAAAREFKRSIPDVRSAFHVMNWKVQYPLTVQYEDLRQAFLSAEGVTDFIAKLVGKLATSAEYDEYLLFKYLLIKGVNAGKMVPYTYTPAANSKFSEAAAFRTVSNMLTFMLPDYNAEGVHTVTPRDDQYIFMDAKFNAEFDVDVLASAFNMDRANFMGHLKLVDSWTTFDNARFAEITAESDMIEAVSATELSNMADVKAIIVDKEWFQVYDNLTTMTETNVNSGLYWNYFYHVWKTISYSPFSNAVVIQPSTSGINSEAPAKITAEIVGKETSEEAVVLTLAADAEGTGVAAMNLRFTQTAELTSAGIAVHPYGALIIPSSQAATEITLEGDLTSANGVVKHYVGKTKISSASDVGATVEMDAN